MVDQIRAIDNRRLLDGPLIALDEEAMRRVARSLNQVLGVTN
jgi:hypothetical protein